ncbi:MAG: NAD(P)-binding protein, partial [FCB group bacterium]|nr:NAD(P)-binding protein [FCB group bacterium]
MNKKTIHIVGAGPANLVAAINLARAGIDTVIHEQGHDVGLRFNGDFQGLENWSFGTGVMEFLESIGISITFRCEPYYGGEFFGPNMESRIVKTAEPLFYLVERGTGKDSLDQGLKQQAIEAGVRIQWNDKLTRVPGGTVIVGTGPKAADIIAKGIV